MLRIWYGTISIAYWRIANNFVNDLVRRSFLSFRHFRSFWLSGHSDFCVLRSFWLSDRSVFSLSTVIPEVIGHSNVGNGNGNKRYRTLTKAATLSFFNSPMNFSVQRKRKFIFLQDNCMLKMEKYVAIRVSRRSPRPLRYRYHSTCDIFWPPYFSYGKFRKKIYFTSHRNNHDFPPV